MSGGEGCRVLFFRSGCGSAAGTASAPPFSSSLRGGFLCRFLRGQWGKGPSEGRPPTIPSAARSSFLRAADSPQIGESLVELRPGDRGSRPSGRHLVQGRLKGQDRAKPVADPLRDGYGPRYLFHEGLRTFLPMPGGGECRHGGVRAPPPRDRGRRALPAKSAGDGGVPLRQSSSIHARFASSTVRRWPFP